MIEPDARERIDRIVWNLYEQMPEIRFPIDMVWLINAIPNCRYMTYARLAEINNCGVRDIVKACGSSSGCAHYRPSDGTYLITCNHSRASASGYQRIRWTAAHELGHVLLGHLENHGAVGTEALYGVCEEESHAFAASLLAPLPLFGAMKIKNRADIARRFGISAQAAAYRMTEYERYLDPAYCKNRCEEGMERNANFYRIIYPR